MTYPEDTPKIRKPEEVEDREHHEIDAVELFGPSCLRSYYPEGIFAEHHADEGNLQLIASILADPHSFKLEKIKEALIPISRDFRDLGGLLEIKTAEFEKPDPADSIKIGYQFSVYRSGYDSKVIQKATLQERHVRLDAGKVLDQLLIDDLKEQGRQELPLLIVGDNALTGRVDIFNENRLRFGIWSSVYKSFVYTYADDLTLSEHAHGDTTQLDPGQVVLQHEEPLNEFSTYQLPTPAADLYLSPDGYGDRNYRVDLPDDSTFTLSKYGADPGAVLVIATDIQE